MHVVIVGAGEVGGFLAERLGAEGIDITVVEQNPERAAALANSLDIQVIIGSGSDPVVLDEAGIDRAGIVAAVTQVDEVNLITSLLAKERGVSTTVVRVENPTLRGPAGANLLQAVGADVVIDPDAETADEILALVHATGADEIYPMANGELVVVGAIVGEESPFVDRSLRDISDVNEDYLCGTVTRDGETIIPAGDQVLRAGDHVRLLCRAEDQGAMLRLLGAAGRRARRVMVLGGGAVGSRVAQRLEYEGAEVTLIERDQDRAEALAEKFRRVIVVQGDVTDTELLLQESIGDRDAVVAATGEDASNVLACAFAIAEGSPYTIAVLHRLALLPLVRRLGIDSALSPRTASTNAVLRQVRGGAAVATFLESDIEVDEIAIVEGSKADGSTVADLGLPADMLIGALIRAGQRAVIVRGSTVLAADDHIVAFGRPSALTAVRSLFEP